MFQFLAAKNISVVYNPAQTWKKSVRAGEECEGVKRLRTSHNITLLTSAQLPPRTMASAASLPVRSDCAPSLRRDGPTNSFLESYWSDESIPSIEGEGQVRDRDESRPTLIGTNRDDERRRQRQRPPSLPRIWPRPRTWPWSWPTYREGGGGPRLGRRGRRQRRRR